MAQSLSPFTKFEAVTLSDTVNFSLGMSDAIYIGTKGVTGTIVGVLQDGATITFVGLLAGTIYPLRLKRINTTTTDASNIVAMQWK